MPAATEIYDIHESRIIIPVIGTSFLLRGRLCVPIPKDSSPQALFDSSSLDLVFILHGFLGHKDYCYQKQLAHDLPKQKGYATIRFDFMGCGDSFPPNILSRTIQNDIRDLDSMLEWIRHYNSHPSLLDLPLSVNTKTLNIIGGVGHSRGSHCLLAWAAVHALASPEYASVTSKLPAAVRNLKYHITPGVTPLLPQPSSSFTVSPPLRFLVSCSGRYRTSYLMESYINRIPDFKERQGEPLTLRRPDTKQVVDSWVPYSEIEDLSSIPIGQILDILLATWASPTPKHPGHGRRFHTEAPNLTKFLTVYGDADHIVPVMDAYLYTSHFVRAGRESQRGSSASSLRPSLFETKFPIDDTYSKSVREPGKNATIYPQPLPENVQKLVLVPNADHNFYGKPRAYIVPKEKRANYNPQTVRAILNWMNEVLESEPKNSTGTNSASIARL